MVAVLALCDHLTKASLLGLPSSLHREPHHKPVFESCHDYFCGQKYHNTSTLGLRTHLRSHPHEIHSTDGVIHFRLGKLATGVPTAKKPKKTRPKRLEKEQVPPLQGRVKHSG